MAERVFKNFATSKLASGVGQTDAALALATDTGALFPSIMGADATAQEFSVVLTDGTNIEVMVCTARSGDTLTVTRGSPAFAWLAGTEVKHVISAGDMANFLQKGVLRTVTTDPDGSLAATYFGEEVLNTTTKEWWKNSNYADPTEWRVTGHRGTIRVHILPQEAVDAGAKWTVDAGAWIDSMNYSAGLPTGAHTLTFKPTTGYTTPTAVVSGVVAYRTTDVTVTYVAT